MEKSSLSKSKLPDKPGVYFFLGPRKRILYIGKATSLKNRVPSYFTKDIIEKRSPVIEKMVKEALSVEYTVTDSVLEALILETNLIRTHKPKFNSIGKDQKSYNHLVITNEEFPRVLVVRAKDLTEKFTKNDIQYEFGPYPSGTLFKEALNIIRRLFKFYDTKKPIGTEKSKIAKGQIDFNRQIGLYPNENNEDEYNKTIRHIRLFFEGKKEQIIEELQNEMLQEAKSEKFEQANIIKRKIFALQHIQDIALIKADNKVYRDEDMIRIEAYDIAHMAGDSMVGAMIVLEAGEPIKSEYRKFKIQTISGPNDTAALAEIFSRRMTHTEWPLPQLIVVDGSVAQKRTVERILKQKNLVIPVIGVVKNDKHKPVKIIGQTDLIKKFKDMILLSNSEAHRFAIEYHRKNSRKNLLNSQRKVQS